MTCVVVTFRLYLCRCALYEKIMLKYPIIILFDYTPLLHSFEILMIFSTLPFFTDCLVYGYLFSLISFNKWQQSHNWLLMKWWVGKLIVQFIVWQEKIISLNNDKIFFIWIKGLQRTQKRINKILSCTLASVTFLWSDTLSDLEYVLVCRYYIENCIKAKSYTKYI